jgi:hypothetical protein
MAGGPGTNNANVAQAPRPGNAQNRQNRDRRPAQPGGARQGGSGDPGDYEPDPNQAPLTGGTYTQWSEKLRDVEEMVDFPDLRSEIARVRERAQTMRAEFKQQRRPPRWDLVQTQITQPLIEVRQRVDEELARREAKEPLVPLDRDPVPNRYSDLVKRYYEQLGREP